MKKDKKGVILVSRDGQTVAAEQYSTARQGEQLWRAWIDMTSWQADKGDEYLVSDYAIKDAGLLDGRTDRQIAFLMQNFKPERQLHSYKAAYARINGVNPWDAKAVDELVTAQSVRYGRFAHTRNPFGELLNSAPMQALQQAGIGHQSERLYGRDGGFAFFQEKDGLNSPESVARMFRTLENRSVENAFAVFSKAGESFILHLGMGNIQGTVIDALAVIEAQRRVGAEKVWFVHNHPSGNITASREDQVIHQVLRASLGDILQDSIIINTDSGKYGLFNEEDAFKNFRYFSDDPRIPDREIPVFSFDRRVFHDNGSRVWHLYDNQQVASFISSQRLGERSKYVGITVDAAQRVEGVFHLPFVKITADMVPKVADHLVAIAAQSNARAVVLYGHRDPDLLGIGNRIKNEVDMLSGGSVTVMDVVSTLSSEYTNLLVSAAAQDKLDPVRTVQTFVREASHEWRGEVIPVQGGRALLRISAEGHDLPAVFLRKNELDAYSQGKVTADELARMHAETAGRGMHR